ncbi:MAG: hypothetical protein RLY31_1898 [Bacteroidota bacterium]
MKKFLWALAAVGVAITAGSILNLLVIRFGGQLVPPPAGADLTTAEGLRESLHRMAPRHFVMPFLAHALGTLLAGFLAASLLRRGKLRGAMLTGAVFLAGGILAVRMIPAPVWFSVLDLVAAYIPMAWLGYRLQQGLAGRHRTEGGS